MAKQKIRHKYLKFQLLAVAVVVTVLWNIRYLQTTVTQQGAFGGVGSTGVNGGNSISAKVDGGVPLEVEDLHGKSSTNRGTNKEDDTGEDHRVAGLNCEKHGGPFDEKFTQEMVYWEDIPKDAEYISPFANYGPTPKYLTFEPDEGGWNNIRMSMETATVLAVAMGRILVLPPSQPMYLMGNDKQSKNNRFTFKDFFHFDSIASEHPQGLQVISMKEFLEREAVTGQLRNVHTNQVTFTPHNKTDFSDPGDGSKRLFFFLDSVKRSLWAWLRNATEAPIWSFDKCVAIIPKVPGEAGLQVMDSVGKEFSEQEQKWSRDFYVDNPTPVDGPPLDRLKEVLGPRRELCTYNEKLQSAKVVHFMGDNASGARLLTHFYSFLFFEDWHHDLWTKRFVRDHLRYIDEIQCAAARVVTALRQRAREYGGGRNPDGIYDSFHIRRGDFQYKQTRIEADEILDNVRDLLEENSTIFIATDEKNMTFFDPFRKHYNIYFLHDFKKEIHDTFNVNYFGMLDQRIASRGRTFIGSYFSTFTGYINRMRGYHAHKGKWPGYELGKPQSYFYVPKRHREDMQHYHAIHPPFWAREFPVGWRDIDHDLS